MLTEEPSSKKTVWQKRFAGVNIAFALSIFAHLALLLLIGGAVLQYGHIDPKMFSSEVLDSPPTEEEPPEVPTPEATPEDAAQNAEKTSSNEAAAPELLTMDVSTPTANVVFSANVPTDLANTGFGSGPSGNGNGSGKGSGSLKKISSVFGSKEQDSKRLSGTFYDLKQNGSGEANGMTPEKYSEEVRNFLKDWKEETFSKYFKAPDPLYAGRLFIPAVEAAEGPAAFGVGDKVKGTMWVALYRGTITPPTSGKFRFVGRGDDLVIVRFNGKVVLDQHQGDAGVLSDWKPTESAYDYPSAGFWTGLQPGTWFNASSAQSYPIEILIGERPGGWFACFLMFEESGKKYEGSPKAPKLPIFQIEGEDPFVAQPEQKVPDFMPVGPLWKGKS